MTITAWYEISTNLKPARRSALISVIFLVNYMEPTVSASGLRKYFDFAKGGVLQEHFLELQGGGRKGTSVELNGGDIELLIKILARWKVQVHADYKFNEGIAAFDIPFQSFWKIFGNPLMPANAVEEFPKGSKLNAQIHQLQPKDGEKIPHAYRVIGSSRLEANQVDMEALFGDKRHHIDISRFKQRAEVVVAATYIEAILQTLVKDIPLIDIEKNKGGRDYNAKIECCRRNRILNGSTCKLLHDLRKLRNSAAHDYEISSGDSPFKTVAVPHASQEFIFSLRRFVSSCEKRYGVPDQNTQRFYRASELLAGEINQVARLHSVIELGVAHPDELDEYFE